MHYRTSLDLMFWRWSTSTALHPRSDVLQSMYNKLRAIQTGDEADIHGWMREIA